MKKTLTSLVAASIVLGSISPVFAATVSKKQYPTGSPRAIVLNGQAFSHPPALVHKLGRVETTYMGLFYVQVLLKKLGYSTTWNGHVLDITTPSGQKVNVGKTSNKMGTVVFRVDGQEVFASEKLVGRDPNTNRLTSYVPIYFVMQILNRLNLQNKWNGHTWTITSVNPDAVKTVTVSANAASTTIGSTDQLSVAAVANNGSNVDLSTGHTVAYSVVNSTYGTVNTSGVFTATQAGTYQVTATVDGVVSAPLTITVAMNETVSVSAAQANVGVGVVDALKTSDMYSNNTPVDLTNKTVTYTVTSSNAATAFVTPSGTFVATAPGAYTVEASVDGFTSKPLTINVFGQASSIKMETPTSVVANGQTKNNVTVTVFDAAGNKVSDFNGTVTVNDTQSLLVGTTGALTNSLSVPVSNGVATVQVQSPSTPGVSDSLTANNLVPSGGSALTSLTAQATLTSVPQVATAITVTPDATSVQNNIGTSDNVKVQVVDQSGVPMLSGSYPVTISVSGNAQGSIYGQTSYVTAYSGDGSATNAVTVPVSSSIGVSGTITVTASDTSNTGITSGSANIKAVTVGAASAVQVTPVNANPSFQAGNDTGAVFNVQTVDANGYVVNAAPYTVTVTNADGSALTTSEHVTVGAVVNGQVTITGTTSGNYVLKVSSGTLTAASTPFTITAGTPTAVQITSPANSVSVGQASPSLSVNAQLVDQYGNTVSEANVPVEFTATEVGGTGNTYTLNGTNNSYTATTNASGVATVMFASQATPNIQWNVSVDKVNNATPTVPTVPVTVSVVALEPSVLSASVVDVTASNTTTTYAKAGDQLNVTLTEKDPYGNVSPNQDWVSFTLPVGLTLNPSDTAVTAIPNTTNEYKVQLSSGGSVVVQLEAKSVGNQQVTFKDMTDANSSVQTTLTEMVSPGTQSTASVLYGSNPISTNNPLNVTANTPVALTIAPTDSQGNIVSTTEAVYGVLNNSNGGSFRLQPNGANITGITIPAGSTGVTVYYINAATESITSGFDVQLSTAGSAITASKSGSAYAQNDTITFTLATPVKVADLNVAGITVGNSHSLGSGAAVYANNADGNGYATSFTIKLGSSPTVATGDSLTIASADLVNVDNQQALQNVVFTTP